MIAAMTNLPVIMPYKTEQVLFKINRGELHISEAVLLSAMSSVKNCHQIS